MLKNINIIVGSDHRGLKLKENIISFLNTQNIKTLDIKNNADNTVDYPLIAKQVAHSILEERANYGILICNTGIGMSIAANRFHGIRAALCPKAEYGEMAKKHNNANILIFGSGYISTEEVILTIQSFLNSKFEEGRHIQRLLMLDK